MITFAFPFKNQYINIFTEDFDLVQSANEDECVWKVESYDKFSAYLKYSIIDNCNISKQQLEAFLSDFRGSILSDSNELLTIILYKREKYEEYKCNAVLLKRDFKIGTHGLWESCKTRSLVLYNIDKDLNYDSPHIISLTEDITRIKICVYKSPMNIPVDTKSYIIPRAKQLPFPPNPDFPTSSFNEWKPKGYGIRSSFCVELIVDILRLQILFHNSKIVYEEEYETISHASMDPGPEWHYESTSWYINAIKKFYSLKDLEEYLDKTSEYAVDASNIVGFNHGNKFKIYRRGIFSNISVAEKALDVSFYEYWS